MGVSENSVPLNPMVFLIIIPIKWLFVWEYTLFSDKAISEIESEDDEPTRLHRLPKNRTLFQLIELQTLMSPRKCVPFDRFFSSVKTPNDRLVQKNGVFTHPKWDTMGI